MTASYQLIDEKPESHYAQRARNEGIPGVTEVIDLTPDHVIDWFVDDANDDQMMTVNFNPNRASRPESRCKGTAPFVAACP